MTLNFNQHNDPPEAAPEDIGLLIDGLLDGKFAKEEKRSQAADTVGPGKEAGGPTPAAAAAAPPPASAHNTLICEPNLSEHTVTVKSSLYPLNAPCRSSRLSLRTQALASIGADRPRPVKLHNLIDVNIRRESKLNIQNDIFKEDLPYIWDVTFGRTENLSVAFTLENSYIASLLRIKAIVLRAEGEDPDLRACGAEISVQGKPLEGDLEISESRQLCLKLAKTPPLGDYNLKLSISLEAPAPDRSLREITRTYPILLKVKPQKIIEDGILAIDFGTTSSCAALVSTDDLYIFNVENERLTNLQDSEKKRLLSYISYNMPEPVLGRQAYDDARENPQACCSSPKSLIGSRSAVEILQNQNGRYTETQIPLQEIIGRFYRTLSKYAQDSLAKNGSAIRFNSFVITHPSSFNYKQIEQIKSAAFEAFKDVYQAQEMSCIKTVPEPVAVAFDYICDPLCQSRIHNKFGLDDITYTILVYDCGGGTTDLCCLRVHSLRRKHFCESEDLSCEFDKMSVVRQNRFIPAAAARLADKYRMTNAAELTSVLLRHTDWTRRWNILFGPMKLPFGREELIKAIESAAAEAAESRHNLYSYANQVTVLNASGSPTFGGNKITRVISDFIENDIAGHNIRLISLSGFGAGGSDLNTVKKYAKQNEESLFRIAELTKIKFAELKGLLKEPSAEDRAKRIGSLLQLERTPLRIFVNSGGRSTIQRLDAGLVAEIVQKIVADESIIEGELNREIQPLAQEYKNLLKKAGIEKPDVILISGLASQWPQIKNLIRKDFGSGIEYPHSLDLKFCVVAGAGKKALWDSQRFIPADNVGKVITTVFEQIFTTQSLGYYQNGFFTECIGAGTVLEDGQGLRVGMPFIQFTELELYTSSQCGSFRVNADSPLLQKIGSCRLASPLPADSLNPELVIELRRSAERPGCADLELYVQSGSGRHSLEFISAHEADRLYIFNK